MTVLSLADQPLPKVAAGIVRVKTETTAVVDIQSLISGRLCQVVDARSFVNKGLFQLSTRRDRGSVG